MKEKVKLLVPFVIGDKSYKKGATVELDSAEVEWRLETGEVERITAPESIEKPEVVEDGH